jgi:crotonobetainyl-CoA dehydrogenase
MKNMLYEAAWKAENNGGDFMPGPAAACKYYCANASFEVVDDAMQVMGGIAVASEHRINRIWRDLRVDRVSGGTDEMMILTAGKQAIKPFRK